MLCDDLERWGRENEREAQEGGDMETCMHMADLLCCATETNSIVKQLYYNKYLLKKTKKLPS